MCVLWCVICAVCSVVCVPAGVLGVAQDTGDAWLADSLSIRDTHTHTQIGRASCRERVSSPV